MNVLLIDDDLTVLRCLVRYLRDRHHTPTTVCSMAAVPYDLQKFELIITDGHFPGGTGLQIAERAADLGVPCCIFSGDHSIHEQAVACNRRFIGKPETLQLMALVDEIASLQRPPTKSA